MDGVLIKTRFFNKKFSNLKKWKLVNENILKRLKSEFCLIKKDQPDIYL